MELFQKHFNFERLSVLLRSLFRTKNKRKHKELVDLIRSGLRDLKDKL